jgi:SulP family sulfate permease
VPSAWRAQPRKDIVGGLIGAILTLPLSMGLGALALAPFGPAYAAGGVLAGLYAAAFLGLIAVLAGARGVAIYAPRSLVSFMVAAASASLLVDAEWLPKDDPQVVIAALFLLMSLSGAFQFLFGALHLAQLVKYIPTPVVAGFQNAASLLIVFSQLHVLLGVPARLELADLPNAFHDIRPATLALGVFTLVLAFWGPRLTKRVPALLLGLAGGIGAFYLLRATGFDSAQLGGTLGHVKVATPDGSTLASIMVVATRPGFLEALPAILLAAASIAVVASLDVLISAKAVETLSGQRGNSTRELLCIGTANTLTPLLGGIAGSISLSPTVASHRSGGSTALALFVHAMAFLVLVSLAGPLLAFIPNVVIAALVVHAGTQLFDRWSVQLARRVFHRETVNWDIIALDIAVIVLVAAIAIAGSVVNAVLFGIAIGVVMFTLRMSRGMIRSVRYGTELSSRRARDAASVALLQQEGRRIVAIELEGPMFFASAELLHNRVDAALASDVRYLILDLSRVNELDSSGARILVQTQERARRAGARLLCCGHEEHLQTASMLQDQGVAAAIGRGFMFADLDRALEWCENDLLAAADPTRGATAQHALEDMDLTRGLSAAQCAILREQMVRRDYPADTTIFSEGDEGDALYVIAHGAASVRMRVGEAGSDIRLVTFSAGTLFGEMALLDSERRSATVTTDDPLSCFVLGRESFERLLAAHPQIGQQVLANIARALSLRMRRANRTLASLA